MIISKQTGRLTFNFIFLAIIMLVLGVIGIFAMAWYSILFFFLGIVILSIVFGFQINTETMEMRNYYQVLGLRVGKWKSIKEIKYLAVVRIKTTQNIGVLTIVGSQTKILHKLNLILDNKEIVYLYSGEQKQVMKIAENIADKLNLRIYDANSKKWIKKER